MWPGSGTPAPLARRRCGMRREIPSPMFVPILCVGDDDVSMTENLHWNGSCFRAWPPWRQLSDVLKIMAVFKSCSCALQKMTAITISGCSGLT